jgi:dynein heavy chain, axonemal
MDYERWMQGSFVKNSAKEIEQKIRDEYIRELTKLTNIFSNERMDEKAANIARDFRSKIDEFRRNQWIFDFLTNEAMANLKKSAGHWKEIFKELNFPKEFEPSEEMNLKQLLENGIATNKELIENISKRAEGQFKIEKKLKEIED